MADDNAAHSAGRHRPKTTTVFVAAFVAGAVAAVVVNRALDVHLAQSKPQVESEPIFVALRAMPQGSPVTVWDVALRDWPRAMLPSSALRAGDSFEGSVLKYPVREGQPLLAVQLMPAERPAEQAPAHIEEAFVPPPPAAPPTRFARPEPQAAPVESVAAAPATVPAATPAATPVTKVAEPAAATPVARAETAVVEKPAAPETVATTTPPAAPEQAVVPIVPETPAETEAVAEKTVAAPAESRKRFELEPIDVAADDSSKEEQPAADEPTAPTPAPPAKQEPTLADSDVEPLPEKPSRPAVDLEKIPSVMARSEKPAKPAEPSVSNNPVRYLVVPERIARQADTSFVPPPAVEPTPEPAAVPTPPPAANPIRSAQTSTPPVKGFPQRPGTPARASRPRSKQATPRPSQQMQPQTQSRPQQQPQKKTPTQAQSQAQPKQTAQQRQPQQGKPSPERSRPETASKNREPMFPVLAAGLEAMGSRWRGSSDQEATATDQPSTARRR